MQSVPPHGRPALSPKPAASSVTEIFGVGPVIAGTVIGDAGGISRFATRDHFAAYNLTWLTIAVFCWEEAAD